MKPRDSWTVRSRRLALLAIGAAVLAAPAVTAQAAQAATASASAAGCNPLGSVAPVAAAAVNTDAADTVAPTAPSGLRIDRSGPAWVSLVWSPSQDNIGVTGYDVWVMYARCAPVKATTVPGGVTTATVTLNPSYTFGAFLFYIKAFDAAGNLSPQSNVVYVSAVRPPSPS